MGAPGFVLPVVAVGVLLLAGCAYQRIRMKLDLRRYAATATLVRVSGSDLYMRVSGQPCAGVPTVVLDTGLGNVSAAWNLVQPALSAFAQVCAYDRAGYGWSDSGPLPRTSSQIAAELHTLLRTAGMEPPYLLVGHSFGGLNMLQYARKYPQDVAGVVLVDALSPFAAIQDAGSFRFFVRWNRMQFRILAFACATGLYRLYLAVRGPAARPAFIRKLPPEQQRSAVAELARRTHATAAAETDRLYASAAAARSSGSFPDVPLAVLAHTLPDLFTGRMSPREVEQAETMWRAMQAGLAALSPQGRLEVVAGAGHHIHLDKPEAVVAAVASLLATIATSPTARPLDASPVPVVHSTAQPKTH